MIEVHPDSWRHTRGRAKEHRRCEGRAVGRGGRWGAPEGHRGVGLPTVHLNPCAPPPLCTSTPVHLDPCAPQPLCTSTPVHLNADCTKMYALFPYDVCPLPSPMVYAVNRLQCTFYTPDDVCTMPPYDVCSIPSPHDVCSIPCRPLTIYACFMLPPTMCVLCLPNVAPLV